MTITHYKNRENLALRIVLPYVHMYSFMCTQTYTCKHTQAQTCIFTPDFILFFAITSKEAALNGQHKTCTFLLLIPQSCHLFCNTNTKQTNKTPVAQGVWGLSGSWPQEDLSRDGEPHWHENRGGGVFLLFGFVFNSWNTKGWKNWRRILL